MISRPGALRLVHHHPGRLRVRADAFVNDGAIAGTVREALLALPPVRQVTHNPGTGSLLIEYDPGKMEPDAIITVAAHSAGLERVDDETIAKADPEDPVRHVVDGARTLNDLVNEASGGRFDLRMLVPAGLFGYGLYSLAVRPRLPRWENLFVWSYQFFMSLNQEQLERLKKEGARP